MTRRLCFFVALLIGFAYHNRAQYLYYKNPDRSVVSQFRDSARRVMLVRIDSNDILRRQFDYILKFYPKMLVKKIIVSYNTSSKIVFTKPKFSALFKMPEEREYKVYFSRQTHSTLDSVMLQNLSFNAQLGLIANQVSQIEDFSTGGFFDFIAWYFRRLTRRGRNKTYTNNEEKTMEVGLGYQLISLNRELEKNLRIENWMNTNGYTRYARHMRNQAMRPELIINFINDLPFYVGKQYK